MGDIFKREMEAMMSAFGSQSKFVSKLNIQIEISSIQKSHTRTFNYSRTGKFAKLLQQGLLWAGCSA
jgi:hypothetical protein